MKRLAVLLVVAGALLAPAAASAHPLGNFTINRFSRVEVSGHRLYVRYVLDMAEIPTFQAGHIDAGA
jgi:nickel/cobalt transporter (NicO) family protein